MVFVRTGNLNVSALRAAWHGAALPDPADELRALADWKARGFRAVEDYVSWAVAEPRPGRWDFSRHRAAADAARAAGLDYWVFLWLHVSPPWFRAPDFRSEGDSTPAWVPMRCV